MKRGPSCWPSGVEADLIRAAALPGEPGAAAWARSRTSISSSGPLGDRLVPAIYSNLHEPEFRMKHRAVWLRNQELFGHARELIEALQGAGIDVLVLKGAALATLNYPDTGGRRMGDVDLLVAPGLLARAADVAVRGGWREIVAEKAPNGPLKYGRHFELEGGRGTVDLHGYALAQSADDSDFWEASIAFDFAGTQARGLAPADQLLHVCVHGLRWLATGPSPWIVDALRIMQTSDVDWQRLVARAASRHLTVATGAALAHLRAGYAPEVPLGVVEALATHRAGAVERLAHRAAMRPPTAARLMVLTCDRYLRFRRAAPATERPGFREFLQESWGLSGTGEVVRRGVRKTVERNYRASPVPRRR